MSNWLKLEPFKDLIGKLSDNDVVTAADCSIEDLKAYAEKEGLELKGDFITKSKPRGRPPKAVTGAVVEASVSESPEASVYDKYKALFKDRPFSEWEIRVRRVPAFPTIKINKSLYRGVMLLRVLEHLAPEDFEVIVTPTILKDIRDPVKRKARNLAQKNKATGKAEFHRFE